MCNCIPFAKIVNRNFNFNIKLILNAITVARWEYISPYWNHTIVSSHKVYLRYSYFLHTGGDVWRLMCNCIPFAKIVNRNFNFNIKFTIRNLNLILKLKFLLTIFANGIQLHMRRQTSPPTRTVHHCVNDDAVIGWSAFLLMHY
jgi:hypothetical protein